MTAFRLSILLSFTGVSFALPASLSSLWQWNKALSSPELHNIHHALATAAYVDYYDIQGAFIERLGKRNGWIFDADAQDRAEIDATLRMLCVNPRELKILFSTTSKIHHCCTPKRIFLNEHDYDMFGPEEKEFLLAHLIEHIKHNNLARKVLHRTTISLGVDFFARGIARLLRPYNYGGTRGLFGAISFEVLDVTNFLLSSKWVQLVLGHRICSWSTQIDEERCDAEAAANLRNAAGGIRLCGKHRTPRTPEETFSDRVVSWLLKKILPTQCWAQETDFNRMQKLWELQDSYEKLAQILE